MPTIIVIFYTIRDNFYFQLKCLLYSLPFLVNQSMQLKPNCGSDRAWMWSVPADFADETPKPELLAVRFANAESIYKT